MEYTYKAYEGAKYNFIGLESVVCIVLIIIDVDKDIYTLDVGVLDKHMDCEIKRRGLCSEGRGRKNECATLVIAATPSKRGRPPKGPLVFVNTIPTSTSNTHLRCSTRIKKII